MRLRMRRRPVLHRAGCILVCVAHLIGCYTAATCRGYPPPPWWATSAMYVAPFLCGIPGLFDDDRSVRHRGVILMSVGMGIIHAVAWSNLATSIPHFGYSLGFFGTLIFVLPWLPYSVITIPFIAICLFYVERVFGDCWGLVRHFPNPDERHQARR